MFLEESRGGAVLFIVNAEGLRNFAVRPDCDPTFENMKCGEKASHRSAISGLMWATVHTYIHIILLYIR